MFSCKVSVMRMLCNYPAYPVAPNNAVKMNYRWPLSVIHVPTVNSRHSSLHYRSKLVPGNIFICLTDFTVLACYFVLCSVLCNIILKLSYLLVKTLNIILLLVPKLSVCMS